MVGYLSLLGNEVHSCRFRAAKSCAVTFVEQLHNPDVDLTDLECKAKVGTKVMSFRFFTIDEEGNSLKHRRNSLDVGIASFRFIYLLAYQFD